MAMHSHSTPHEGCSTTDASGLSYCTVYYLMASEMANGSSTGYWELSISLDQDSVHFYPPVMMAMGDTVRAVLKGQQDMIMTMSSGMGENGSQMDVQQEARAYYLFNDGLFEGEDGSYQLSLFIAAKNSMSDHPIVATGGTLTYGLMTVHLQSVVVELSVDGVTWLPAQEAGYGHYTVTGITGLEAGVESSLQVRLIVNGEQKTTDGQTLADTNGAATFFVTP
jgi:hypothetical protein